MLLDKPLLNISVINLVVVNGFLAPLVAPFKPNSQFKDILKVHESSKTR